MNEQDMIKRKLEFFHKSKTPIHISKNDGRFNNGVVLEMASDLIILDDEVLGATPIYILEIKWLEKRGEKR